jgi:hypothetical protein
VDSSGKDVRRLKEVTKWVINKIDKIRCGFFGEKDLRRLKEVTAW